MIILLTKANVQHQLEEILINKLYKSKHENISAMELIPRNSLDLKKPGRESLRIAIM